MSTTTEIIEIEELALIYSSLTSIDIFMISIGIGYHEEALHTTRNYWSTNGSDYYGIKYHTNISILHWTI